MREDRRTRGGERVTLRDTGREYRKMYTEQRDHNGSSTTDRISEIKTRENIRDIRSRSAMEKYIDGSIERQRETEKKVNVNI